MATLGEIFLNNVNCKSLYTWPNWLWQEDLTWLEGPMKVTVVATNTKLWLRAKIFIINRWRFRKLKEQTNLIYTFEHNIQITQIWIYSSFSFKDKECINIYNLHLCCLSLLKLCIPFCSIIFCDCFLLFLYTFYILLHVLVTVCCILNVL